MATLQLPGPVVEGEYREISEEEWQREQQPKAVERLVPQPKLTPVKVPTPTAKVKTGPSWKDTWKPKETARQVGANIAPLGRAAKQEFKSDIKAIGTGFKSAAKAFFTPLPQPIYVLTPQGKRAFINYSQGDYSLIPSSSIRAALLETAYYNNAVSYDFTLYHYGSDGKLALDLLAESGLIARRR